MTKLKNSRFISDWHKQSSFRRMVFGFFAGLVFLTTLLTIYTSRSTQAVAQGDGLLFYAASANTTPQFRNYSEASNDFSANAGTLAGAQPVITQVKASPTKQEAIAGYQDTSGNLNILCYDGTTWTNEWSIAVAPSGTPTTRRFDIAYESNTGDVTVAYSRNAAAVNALAYRTKAGSSGCGSANWAAAANFPTTTSTTTGTVQWVKAVRDTRSAQNLQGWIWADSNSDLGGAIWSGSAYTNFKLLETSLEVVTSAQDVDDFDLQYETASGDLMVVWANSAGTNGVNGVRYNTCNGGTSSCTWSASAINPNTGTGDDATNLDLSANPVSTSNEIAFASIGNAGSDLQTMYWSGSAWTVHANVDTTCETPAAGMKLVTTGWLTNGANTKWYVSFDDSSGTGLSYLYYTGAGAVTIPTDFTTTPAINDIRGRYDTAINPFNTSEVIQTLGDSTNGIFAFKLTMDGSGALSWSNMASASSLGTKPNHPQQGFAYAYWNVATTVTQQAYRWFNNSNSTDVGSTLAALNTAATAPAEGTPFRLRMLLKVTGASLSQNGATMKLQYAARGVDNACDTSFTNETYADVSTSSGAIKFYNNSTPADDSNLTANANDPTNSPDTIVNQTYQESNNFTNSTAAIPAGQDGKWDFSLVDNGAPAGTTYCFRAVNSDGTTLGAYSQIPQVTTAGPGVSSIAPSAGTTAGGTPFTIKGSKFAAGATVTVGGVSATNVFTVDSNTITGLTGAGTAGAQDVVVTNPSTASGTLAGGFTYTANYSQLIKDITTDFTAGTSVNLLTNGIKIDEGVHAWLDSTPSSSGGSMGANTYYYVLTALDFAGNETQKSEETRGITTTGSTSSISLSWRPIQGAVGYKLYRTTTSGTYSSPSLITTISASGASTINSVISYTDTAAAASSGAPPASNSTNGELVFARGVVPASGAGTFTAGPALTANAHWGAFGIKRPDGKFLIIHAGGVNTTSIYDPVANTMAAGPTLTANSNTGAHALERPDGKFVIVHGGGLTSTSLYDPVANTISAGPTLTAAAGSGSNSLKRPDGKYLIILANTTANTSIYDPVANTMATGPTLVGTAGNGASYGSHSLERPNGTFFIVQGGGSTNTTIYDAVANSFSAGPALTASTDAGSHNIQRPNGTYLINSGNDRLTTSIYDPINNTISSGPAVTAGFDGTQALQRPDGKYLVIHGNATGTNTSIYDPVANSFSTGPASTSAVYEGGFAIQRPDGKYLVICGNTSTNTEIYDAGWYAGTTAQNGTVGTWTSEDLNPTSISSWDQIAWVKTANGVIQSSDGTVDQIEVKTATTQAGLASASYRNVANGASISAGAGEVWLKIKITFSRTIPDWSNSDDGGGADVWTGERTYGNRFFDMPTIQSITATYNTSAGAPTPTTDQLMRHGSWFNSGTEQPYYWAN